ncbi:MULTISPECIES: hypothetical protein [unclassified Chitinophaga]|uniref:hypothetical protein n=1 Tax=unclassified Chitinophaga TaxID=2619133 RepID=UPI0009D09A40|nr:MULTISPECIES: hypothetical protein [unclassified Chitinophaga]OMP75480.1 hypothetical protein BW716_29950 [[Flexibacter] sp. ATCC 35208]WPV65691.1 hypothetical protein QQL36_28205 [Chitinophaga sp. LS1]
MGLIKQALGIYPLLFSFTLGISGTLGRNGIFFVGGGRAVDGPTGGSFSFTINWLNHRDETKDQLDNFLTGQEQSES